jgi:c-di-GMP-binding flagellar brake protein YcgR
MSLSEIELNALKTCCDLNEKLTLNVHEQDELYVYRGRFLAVNFHQGFLVIDEPSGETPGAKPLSRGQSFEVFFEFKTFRYLFNSKVLEHTKFKMGDRGFYGLKILLPRELQDGEKREYFRVQTGMRPPVNVKFLLYERGSDTPVQSAVMEGAGQEFRGELIDISGGGMAIRGKAGDKLLPLEKGDVIKARFKLKAGFEDMEIWCEVRNKRKYKDTEIQVWGLRFFEKEKNKHINYYRNKILRYVTERQREILSR